MGKQTQAQVIAAAKLFAKAVAEANRFKEQYGHLPELAGIFESPEWKETIDNAFKMVPENTGPLTITTPAPFKVVTLRKKKLGMMEPRPIPKPFHRNPTCAPPSRKKKKEKM
jgi:hypothetical protein